MKSVNVVLFNDFESLDVFGPVEVLGRSDVRYEIDFFTSDGGIVTSSQNVQVVTKSYKDIDSFDILLIPGGQGTRKLVDDKIFIKELKELAEKSRYVLTVCTGSGLLAKTGLLDGINATTNKLAYSVVTAWNDKVKWHKKARWVKDKKYYTSSGISAGTDMALDFVKDIQGEKAAIDTAKRMEYIWNEDRWNDPFHMN